MATVRIYYSRENQDYDNWNLFYESGIYCGENITTNYSLLFPDSPDYSHIADYTFCYPRKKMSFTVEGNLGYVDIETNEANKFNFYLQRKDGYHEMDFDNCENSSSRCGMCNITGYIYGVDTSISKTYYVKENSAYLYQDDSYTMLYPQHIDTNVDLNTGEVTVYLRQDWQTAAQKIIDKDKINFLKGFSDLTINQICMVYLDGITIDLGESMQLSLDADELALVKADAISDVEKQIVGYLYKLDEVPADFDDAAFLADTDGYKENLTDAKKGYVEPLKDLINTKNALEA